ncbi:MAG: amidohydrolase family protein [Acidobacteriota bacterium]
MLASAPLPLLVRGKLVQPDGSARDRWLLLREGRVEAVSRQRPPMTEHVVVLDTGSEDWIFPGLFDLHTELDHHVLPPWSSPRAPFARRGEWTSDDGFRRHVRDVVRACEAWDREQGRRVLATLAELQAITGGSTVLQRPERAGAEARPDGAAPSDGVLLGRDATSAEEMGVAGCVLSTFDAFGLDADTGEPRPRSAALEGYVRRRDAGDLRAAFIRVGEGRSGFCHGDGADGVARREFEALMAHPAFADAAAVRRSPLTLVGGGGLDASDRRHLDFLRERRISVLWSPMSDLWLYGDTLDVEALLRAGITVALASGAAPSGSKHVWAEAKFARKWLHAIDAQVADQQIVRMVTVDAARCLGLGAAGQTRSLDVGDLADLFILRSPLETDNPFEAFFAARDGDVRATLVGGRPIYGDLDLLERTGLELQAMPEPESLAAAGKVVHLPPRVGVDVAMDVARLEEFLQRQDPPVDRSHLISASDARELRRCRALHRRAVELGGSVASTS